MEQITQRFENVSASQFNTLAVKVKELTGVEISQPSGTSKAKGYTITWKFEAGDNSLEITCNDAPWPQDEFPHKIAEKIQKLVDGVLDAPASC